MEEGRGSTLYWEKQMPNFSTRFYKAEITQDLFDIVVYCRWGTKGTSRGGAKSYPVADVELAFEKLEEIKKRRKQRGYVLI